MLLIVFFFFFSICSSDYGVSMFSIESAISINIINKYNMPAGSVTMNYLTWNIIIVPWGFRLKYTVVLLHVGGPVQQ